MSEHNRLGTVGIGAAIAIAGGLVFSSLTTIQPGYNGIVYNIDGGIEGTVLGQGMHLVMPWKKVISYPVSSEVVYYSKSQDGNSQDNSINVNTKDGKQVNVSVTYSFHMDPEKLPEIFTKFRGQSTKDIESGYIKNEMYRAINNITSEYNLMELVGNKRSEINTRILEDFRNSLSDIGVIIETFNLSDVVPDDQTVESIQKVVDAQNKLEQAKIEKQTAQVEAEKRIIEAESIAKANQTIQQSLSDNLIKQKWIEKWDGKVPSVQSGNSGLILDIK